jgi:hypothetical protein
VDAATIRVLRRLVRGEEDPRAAVEALGIKFHDSSGAMALEVPADVDVVELPLSDLARGLLAHWTRGTSLREWASLVLMLDIIQFFEAESPEEDRLVKALWAASAGEDLDEGSLAVARALVR